MALQIWLPLHKEGEFISNGLLNNSFNLAGSPSYNSNGEIGGCYQFDGSDDNLYSEGNKTWWGGKEISYALWFKCDKVKDGGTIIDLFADLTLGYSYTTNGLRFTYWRCYKNGSGSRVGDSKTGSIYYDADKWHHVAVTFNRQFNKLYVDGELSEEWDSSSMYTTNWVPLLSASSYKNIAIGRSYGSVSFIGGYVNDVRIYDNCLSESDVKRLALSKTYEVVEGDNMLFERCGLLTGGTQEYNLTYGPGIIKLNGNNSALKVPFNNLQKGTFSMNVWFFRKEFGSDRWETIFGGPSGVELETKPGATSTCNIVAYSWGGNSESKYIPYNLNEWNMLTMTRTTGNTKFYLNGVLKYTGSAGSIPNGDYFIGAWSNYNGQNFKGNVSKFSIYSKELSASEIQFLYDSEKGYILPDEYEQLEYIESNGNQWIDTGIKPCMNKIRCICDMSPLNNADTPFFGSRGTYYMFYNVSGNYFWPTSKCETIQGTLTIGEKYHIDWNKGTLTVTGPNGVYEKGVRSNNTQDTYNMYLFNFNPKDSSRTCVAKLYYFKIYIDNILVRNFIPSKRKSDNVIGMYDMVSRQFFTNSGTGSFTGA